MSDILANPFPTTIQQKIIAGSQFTGELPNMDDAAFDPASGIYKIPEDTKGGLFIFGQTAPLEILTIKAMLSGAGTWNIYFSNGEDDIPWESGTNEIFFVSTDKVVLDRGENIKIVSTGATLGMLFKITAKYEYASSGGGL